MPLGAVATILNVVCGTTGMGFAAVARVTEDQWVACGVRDTIGFGLAPGDELRVKTTICNEIRQHRQVVVIDDALSPVQQRNLAEFSGGAAIDRARRCGQPVKLLVMKHHRHAI